MDYRQGHIAYQLKPRARTDGPPPPTPIDRIIANHHGSTVAVEATPERLRAAKNKPIPSLSERIEQLSAENSNLRHEMYYHQRMYDATRDFHRDITQILEGLQHAVSNFERALREVEEEKTRMQDSNGYAWGEKSDQAEDEEVTQLKYNKT